MAKPWAFTNEGMTRLAELLRPGGYLTQANGHAKPSPSEANQPSSNALHGGMAWLARCLSDFHQQRHVPDGSRLAIFAEDEAHLSRPALGTLEPAASAPPTLEAVMRGLVKARRLITYSALASHLEQQMSRHISLEEASDAARATGEIHVYGDGPTAGYLWQGR